MKLPFNRQRVSSEPASVSIPLLVTFCLDVTDLMAIIALDILLYCCLLKVVSAARASSTTSAVASSSSTRVATGKP